MRLSFATAVPVARTPTMERSRTREPKHLPDGIVKSGFLCPVPSCTAHFCSSRSECLPPALPGRAEPACAAGPSNHRNRFDEHWTEWVSASQAAEEEWAIRRCCRRAQPRRIYTPMRRSLEQESKKWHLSRNESTDPFHPSAFRLHKPGAAFIWPFSFSVRWGSRRPSWPAACGRAG
jgi:hypothetical protein